MNIRKTMQFYTIRNILFNRNINPKFTMGKIKLHSIIKSRGKVFSFFSYETYCITHFYHLSFFDINDIDMTNHYNVDGPDSHRSQVNRIHYN